MRFTAKQFGAVIIAVTLSFTNFLPIVYFQRQVLAQGVSDRRREEADKWMELGEKQLESKDYNAARESIDSSKINREFTVTIDSSKINIPYINLEELTYLSIALWKLGKVEEAENFLNNIMKFLAFLAQLIKKVNEMLSKENFPCDDDEIQVFYDKSSEQYHFYEVKNEVCSVNTEGCNIDFVFDVMVSNKQFIAPSHQSQEKVQHCQQTDLNLLPVPSLTSLVNIDPIRTTINEQNHSITNYTRKKHFLHPGKITRKIVKNNEKIYVVTSGEGTGRWPEENESKSESVWGDVDEKLIEKVNEMLSKGNFPCGDDEIQFLYNKRSKRYNFYEVKNEVCSVNTEGCNIDFVFDVMVSNKQFIAPGHQSQEKVQHCQQTDVDFLFGPWDKDTIITTINKQNHSITNYRRKHYVLQPSKITRKIVKNNEKIYVVTSREGTGVFSRKYESVWGDVDEKLREKVNKMLSNKIYSLPE